MDAWFIIPSVAAEAMRWPSSEDLEASQEGGYGWINCVVCECLTFVLQEDCSICWVVCEFSTFVLQEDGSICWMVCEFSMLVLQEDGSICWVVCEFSTLVLQEDGSICWVVCKFSMLVRPTWRRFHMLGGVQILDVSPTGRRFHTNPMVFIFISVRPESWQCRSCLISTY